MLILPTSLHSQATTCRTHALAHCWKITRADGTVFRFTDWPHVLKVRESGSPTTQDYSPSDGMESTARRREDELDPVNKEMRGIISSDLIKTEDLRAGRFDLARVDEFLVDARMPWAGYLENSRYYIRTVSYDRGSWKADTEGLGSVLDRPVGDVWGPTCRVDLFSTKCGLAIASFERAFTVSSIVEDRKIIQISFGGSPGDWSTDGWANDGTILFDSGDMDGIQVEIKTYEFSLVGQVTFHLPTPFDIAVNDTGLIRPGCNKKSGVEKDANGVAIAGHCKDKFNNLVNFQGEPHIPGRDNLLTGIPIR